MLKSFRLRRLISTSSDGALDPPFIRLPASPQSALRVQTKSQMRARLDTATWPIHWLHGRQLRSRLKQRVSGLRDKPCRKSLGAARVTAPKLVTDRSGSIRLAWRSQSGRDVRFGIEWSLIPTESPATSGRAPSPRDRQNILAVPPPVFVPRRKCDW